MKGVLKDVNKHSLLKLIKVTVGNKNVLHRLHFELSQVIKNKDNAIECVNHINNSKIMRVILSEGKYSRE